MTKDRVVFFGPYDGSIPMYFERIEEVVLGYENGNHPKTINDYLEMFHILQFVEHRKYPNTWSNERIRGVLDYKSVIAKFFTQLTPETLCSIYSEIEHAYQKSVWQIVDRFRLKHLVRKEVLQNIITSQKSYLLRDLLQYKWIVEYNGQLIAEFLMVNPHTAEWLLDYYVAKDTFGKDCLLYFPKVLSGENRDIIIRNYINSPKANLNYVRLVLVAKRSVELPLHPLTVKAARKREVVLNQEVLEHGVVQTIAVGVCVDHDKAAPIKRYEEDENGRPVFIYNKNIIDGCPDATIIYYCGIVFEFMTLDGLITHISKDSDVSGFERVFEMQAKNTYFTPFTFRWSENIAILQMKALEAVLHEKGRKMENIIKNFYEEHLKAEFGYKGRPLTLPSSEQETVVKIRNMAIEMDSVAHQYECFVENGSIDDDLIELSTPKKLTDSMSLMRRRYCVLNKNNQDVSHIIRLFFGSQSMLFYVNPYKELNLKSLYELLEKGFEVNYDSYQNYQKTDVDFLIDGGYLTKDENGILKCEKMLEVIILQHLHEYGACGYWSSSSDGRAILDDMERKGWVAFDNHLFTPEEVDYFSYYLNNEKFTNGPAIRNNYAHGTTPSYSENKHLANYSRLQFLFVMLLLKIAEDLDLKRKFGKDESSLYIK